MPRHLTTNDSTAFIAATQVGAASGVASLDGTGKVPSSQLPTFATSPVASVNGHTGLVVLGAGDVGAVSIAVVNTNNGVAPLDSTGRLPLGNLPATAVTSVNGHTGPTTTLIPSDVGAVATTAVGAVSGVAPLDSSSRLPVANLPTTAVTLVNSKSGPTVTLVPSDVGAVPVSTLPTLTTATVANTVTETIVGSFVIPANDASAGSVYRMTVYGTASSTGTPTITFKVRLGGVSGVVLATFPAVTTASGVTSGGWWIETRLMCVSTGSGATWAAGGTLNQQIANLTTAASAPSLTNGTVSASSIISETLAVTATWSAASASNTVSSTVGILSRNF
jgi:hypothetical protein